MIIGDSYPNILDNILRCFFSAPVTIPSDFQGVSYHPRIIVLTDGVATPELVTGSGDFIPDISERLTVLILTLECISLKLKVLGVFLIFIVLRHVFLLRSIRTWIV